MLLRLFMLEVVVVDQVQEQGLQVAQEVEDPEEEMVNQLVLVHQEQLILVGEEEELLNLEVEVEELVVLE